MALIIEDGTIVAGANSFVTVAEARDYASDRGIDLPAADEDVEHALVKATDYLLSYESHMRGSRVDATQPLVYPRRNVILFGTIFPYDEIPQQIKDAQIVLATYAAEGTDLRPVGSGREVRREEVGPLKKEYFEGGRSSVNPIFNAANDVLQPLLKTTGSAFMPVVRA